MARRTARQIAASRRNIVKAQAESARSRRGKKRSRKTGHHYGEGRTGRRQARRNKYGSRKHGISIAQQQRRDRRSAARRRRVGYAVTGATLAATAYGSLSPSQKHKVKTKARDYGETASIYAKGSKMVYKTNRQMGHGRRASAKAAVPKRRAKRRS